MLPPQNRTSDAITNLKAQPNNGLMQITHWLWPTPITTAATRLPHALSPGATCTKRTSTQAPSKPNLWQLPRMSTSPHTVIMKRSAR